MQPTSPASGLQTRLALLAQNHGQAEIARKTATSRQNVSRYLKGRRVPLEFGASLVEGLGVNPAWLVVGEGSPYLADVNAATAETASDIVEMVRAMEAVSKRRLGELAGKEYAGKLRDLSDSLQSFERIRERLNKQTRPWMSRIAGEMMDAVHAGRLAHARSLDDACAQLGRFCTDGDLRDAHMEARAYLQHRLGNDDAALLVSQDLFLRRLAVTPRDSNWYRNAHNLVVGMIAQGQLREGRRMCNAALAVMSDGGAETDHYHRQLGLAGILDVELGDLRAALGKLVFAASFVDQGRYQLARGLLEFAELLSGATNLGRCLRAYDPGQTAHRRLLVFAIWLEDPALLRGTYDLMVRRKDEPDEGEDPVVAHARLLLEAITSRKVPEAPPASGPLPACNRLVMLAQMQRLAGSTQAGKTTLEAAHVLAGLPGKLTAPLLIRGTHARNCLVCAPVKPGAEWRQALTAAQEFCERHLAAGYKCFWGDAHRRDPARPRPTGSRKAG